MHGIRFTPRQSARRIDKRRAGPDCRRATTVSEDARRRHLQDGRDLGRGHRVRLGAVPTRSMKKGSGRSSALQPAPSAGHTQDAYNTHSRRTHDALRFHTERRDDGRTAHPRHTHRTYITHTSRTQRSRRWTHSCCARPTHRRRARQTPTANARCTHDAYRRHPTRTAGGMKVVSRHTPNTSSSPSGRAFS